VTVDRRISLYKLEVFAHVVELGHVGRAAEQLFVAQPVVSAHLRSLEERLGAKLFFREGRQLRLTEAGQAAHAWATEVLTRTRELDRHLQGLADGRQGAISLAASMSIGSYILPPTLSRFRSERPLVEIELSIIDSDHALQATEAGECDFAIVFAEAPPSSPSLTGEAIGVEQVVVVGRAGSPPRDDEIGIRDLAQLDFVESPRGLIRRTLIDRQLERIGIAERNIAIQLGHPEAMKRAVQQGLGVALLFRSAVQNELRDGALRELRIRDAHLAIPIYLVRRKAKVFSATQRELIDAIRGDVAQASPASKNS